MHDPHNLVRFLEAQTSSYDSAVEELRRGRKTGHWIWYIFPQIAGLGRSHMSRRYAIASLTEAQAYAAHPVLGARLRECISIVMDLNESSAEKIFGHLDAMKFRSCLTLFAIACGDESAFQEALNQFFDGQRDARTLAALCVKPG